MRFNVQPPIKLRRVLVRVIPGFVFGCLAVGCPAAYLMAVVSDLLGQFVYGHVQRPGLFFMSDHETLLAWMLAVIALLSGLIGAAVAIWGRSRVCSVITQRLRTWFAGPFTVRRVFAATAAIALILAVAVRPLIVERQSRIERELAVQDLIQVGAMVSWDAGTKTQLDAVNRVEFRDTGLGDAEFAKVLPLLRRCPGLSWIDLGRTKITDVTVARITELEQLTHLSLTDTAVTDASCKRLATMPELTYLNIDGTQISLQGLEELLESDSLETIYVGPTDSLPYDVIVELHQRHKGVIDYMTGFGP